MRLIIELNAHPPSKLPLDKLRWIHYKTCVKGFFTQKVHEIEEVGLSYGVGIIMEKGKKLILYSNIMIKVGISIMWGLFSWMRKVSKFYQIIQTNWRSSLFIQWLWWSWSWSCQFESC
jgi:hypothetical protein